jgi:hypothetical protein
VVRFFRFYRPTLARSIPILGVAANRYAAAVGIVSALAVFFSPEIACLLPNGLPEISRWWALVPLLLLVAYGFLRALQERFEGLEEKLATAEKFRAFKQLLGEAIQEGKLVRQSSPPEPLHEWVDRTEAFIEVALDKVAALRFLDNSGYTREELEYDYATEGSWGELRHEKYVREFRVRRLDELAQSVTPEDLNPHFNPQDYEGYFRTEVEGPL